ncbi:mitochondrial carrier domain-containing protein [Xylaria scruposa]|nr:mitochondrial carrier domain-containing protein [Xylaria scruposa]
MPPSPSSTNTNSILPALHHASSGSLGTLISTCSLYPLSLVIARLQVQRQLRSRRRRRRRRGGPAEPGPGPGPAPPEPEAPARDPTDRPPTIPAPTSPRREDRPSSPAAGTPQEEEAEAAAAAAIARGGPRRDSSTRRPPPTAREEEEGKEKEKEYAGIVDAFSRIWSSDGDGGPRAFYTGLAQDATKSVLDSFLFFLFYEWFRSLRLRSRRRAGAKGRRRLGVAEELAVGMAAGACSRSFTTPIANVVTRKQTSSLVDPTGAPGVREIMRRIREERGIAGFWSGYSASLVLTLNPSLTFFLQEILKSTFADQTYDDPGPRLTFLFAATSKAISSLVTYPFQIAKTRLQAGIPLDSDEEPPDSKPEDDAEKSGPVRAVQAFARRSIFGTVARIVQTEGIGSLYDGVGAELLKGFFSHGTTMVAKDVVHKLLFKLYIFVLGALTEIRKRNPQAIAARREALLRLLQRRIGGPLAGKRLS